MDVYKLSPGFSPIFSISTINDFERLTMKDKPHWDFSDGEEPALYAICPICGNPIQMIALFRRTINSPRAHGRHIAHDVPNLADYNHEAYDSCPYANPNAHRPDRDARKRSIEGLPHDIYNLLREQFDRAIYLLKKKLPIFISKALAASMLDDYLATRGYLYVGASLQNLPWMLAYMGPSRGLTGRFVKRETPLAQAIADAKIPGCLLIGGEKEGYLKVARAKGTFLELKFCFIAHSRKVQDHQLSETLDFVVNYGKGTPPRRIYRETLQIDPTYFFNLVNLPPERGQRTHELLALAAEKMLDI